MRLLISTDCVGGVWDYTVTLADALVCEGHEVLVAIIGDPGGQCLELLPGGVDREWRNDRLEWMPGGVADIPSTAEWLRGLVDLWSPDVLHLNQMAYPGATEFTAPAVVAVHSDVASWFTEVRQSPLPQAWEDYRLAVGRGLAAADVVVAPSIYQAGLTEAHYGRRVDHVIHNGVPVDRRAGTERREDAVVTVGRAWDPAKGVEVLDGALARLGGDAPAGYLIGSTEGPNGSLCRPDHLVCTGPLVKEALLERLAMASIYAAPARYEPFGLAVAEAALQGCALILSDIGSFHELWEGCALFFPVGDDGALADAITIVREDESSRRRLAAAARERAREQYSVASFVGRYLELYHLLANQSIVGKRQMTAPAG